jgi:pimeloyl-ACP methyl ester carboxylesterase
MRFKILIALVCFPWFTREVQAQETDTLVDVGGYLLHFHIKKGKGVPIVFESGGGDDGAVWQPLLDELHKSLNATLITYDRAGFGKSGIDTSGLNIISEVQKLETGLKKLGFDQSYFLVAHSLGGSYSMIFAARNQRKVKGAVFIDINTPCFMTVQKTREIIGSYSSQLETFKKERPGVYFLLSNYEITNNKMREAAAKINVPITVIGSDHPPYEGADSALWKNCLKSFATEKPNRKYILATKTGHYVFRERPDVVVKEIISLYEDVCR